MALQALAKYGAATYSAEGSTTVTVTSLGGLNKEFTVDQSNRLLYQEEQLSEVPGEFTIRAAGQSCVLAQVNQRFHQTFWVWGRTPDEPSLLRSPPITTSPLLPTSPPSTSPPTPWPSATAAARSSSSSCTSGTRAGGRKPTWSSSTSSCCPVTSWTGPRWTWSVLFNGPLGAALASGRTDACVFLQLKNDRSVKRVDVEDGYVNIYLDGVRTGAL